MSEALTVREQRLLERCEQTIDAGLEVFVEVGREHFSQSNRRSYTEQNTRHSKSIVESDGT
jgi:hypothetical protein